MLLLALVLVGAASSGWGLLRRQAPAPVPKLRIEVLNGSDIDGLGARCAARLRELGQDVVRVGDADRRDYARSMLLDRRGHARFSQRLAQELGGIPLLLEATEAPAVDLTLILGSDAVRTVLAKARE
jgi:hypothetical protein